MLCPDIAVLAGLLVFIATLILIDYLTDN